MMDDRIVDLQRYFADAEDRAGLLEQRVAELEAFRAKELEQDLGGLTEAVQELQTDVTTIMDPAWIEQHIDSREQVAEMQKALAGKEHRLRWLHLTFGKARHKANKDLAGEHFVAWKNSAASERIRRAQGTAVIRRLLRLQVAKSFGKWKACLRGCH
jgi:hypothetical protein